MFRFKVQRTQEVREDYLAVILLRQRDGLNEPISAATATFVEGKLGYIDLHQTEDSGNGQYYSPCPLIPGGCHLTHLSREEEAEFPEEPEDQIRFLMALIFENLPNIHLVGLILEPAG